MTVDRNLRLSLLLLVLIGASIESLGEESYLFVVVAAAVCGTHWFAMPEWRGMEDRTANVVVSIGAAVFLLERLVLGHFVVICTAHFLAAAQFVLLWCKPTNRHLMWIMLITLAHAAVGTVRTVEIGYGACLILLTLIGSWALLLFLVRRESPAGIETRGLFVPSLRVGMIILLLAMGFFFCLPRVQANIFRQNIVARTQAISGFSERVALGDLGRITLSSQKVMDVKLTRDGQPLRADDIPLYWRGTSMDTYDFQGGRWSWICTMKPTLPLEVERIGKFQTGFVRGGGELKQSINLEPLNTRVLFCLYPVKSMKLLGYGQRPWLIFGHIAGTIVTWQNRTTSLKYEVVSDFLPTAQKRQLDPRDRVGRSVLEIHKKLPKGMDARISRLAREATAEAKSGADKAARIEEYLRDSGRYAYSLDMGAATDAEPISDFLFNRKSGHCEYFASAMVVMLRTLDIPARVVNGFKGGEWNPFGGFYVIRQSHAHAWVEAYFDDTGWTTFDPTPRVDDPPALAAQLVGVAVRFMDYLDVTWVNWFVAYSQDDQKEFFGSFLNRFIGSHVFSNAEEFVDGWMGSVANFLAKGTTEAEERDDSETGKIVRIGKLIAVFVLTILVALAIVSLLHRLIGLLLRRRVRLDAPGLLYHRFSAVMRKRGFRRKDGQTPCEFAAEIETAVPTWRDDVREITVRFCMARYGGRALAPETIGHLSERIRRLAESHR